MSGGTRSVLEKYLQRPVKGYFIRPVKLHYVSVYDTNSNNIIWDTIETPDTLKTYYLYPFNQVKPYTTDTKDKLP